MPKPSNINGCKITFFNVSNYCNFAELMIPKETIDTIFETARIEEVVGDFVSLKKRGVNLLGNCPFHNEKSPSFTVSPIKGIYKCFGCGKAGNSVNFIMDHEHYTYPEALKYLARKYNIEIEEETPSPEFLESQNERESLFVATAFAQKHFTENLLNTDEGKAIGLSYFKERGFTIETIEKFQLGYSINKGDEFTSTAIKNGYQLEFLSKTGLTIIGDDDKQFDRFRGRVMFPIHNLSGRVIAFGGRILNTSLKAAKYLNSPESDIYHKGKGLYGIFFAKKSIIANDNCYLVEGYTDVISMHQKGIENVVASSGTSLTIDQIRQIERYTKKITVLYDGDAAGIKASLRGIDLIIEEGLEVKIVLFPDGEDPDSYSKKVNSADYESFIKNNAKDFIVFKTGLLLDEAKANPNQLVNLTKDIIETITKIQDPMIRSAYIKQCSELMGIEEQQLIHEINKIRKQLLNKKYSEEEKKTTNDNSLEDVLIQSAEQLTIKPTEFQEKDIIRLLFNHGDIELVFIDDSEPREPIEHRITVSQFIIDEFNRDKDFLVFENPLYGRAFNEYVKNPSLTISYFMQHEDVEISNLAINLISSPYELSANWADMHSINVPSEEMVLKQAVISSLYALRMRKLIQMIEENRQKLKQPMEEEEMIQILQLLVQLDTVKKQLAAQQTIVIIK
jgi:DNA primase